MVLVTFAPTSIAPFKMSGGDSPKTSEPYYKNKIGYGLWYILVIYMYRNTIQMYDVGNILLHSV